MPDEAPDSSSPCLPVPSSLIANPLSHTMLATLRPYVEQKVHQAILAAPPSALVLVRGRYLRPPHAEAADSEKRASRFNWHRPTVTRTTHRDGRPVVVVNCFPSAAYVQHYAGLLATWLSGRDASASAAVRYVPPTRQDLDAPFLESNLRDMGKVDVVVVGYVVQLSRLVAADGWDTGEDGDGRRQKTFAWQKRTLPSGRTAAFLECMPSLWGDASGGLVRFLGEVNGAECVIYVGKAGTLRPGDASNELLVTGSTSFLDGERVSWDQVLSPAARDAGGVEEGDIVTVVSPLVESAAWLAEWQPRCDWVDCEIAHMALSAREQKMGFGYLLLISDNVARCGLGTLANEDMAHVQKQRQALFRRAEQVLKRFLDEYR